MSKQPSKPINIIYIKREFPIEVQHYDIVANFHNWDLMPYNDVVAPPEVDEDEPDREEWEA